MFLLRMRGSGIRNVAMTFFFGFFGHVLGLTGRRLSLRLDPTAREFPSPLVTVFDVPIASMRASARPNCLMMIVLLLFLQKQNLANAIYLFGLGTLLFVLC
jgi:hypothetical protein